MRRAVATISCRWHSSTPSLGGSGYLPRIAEDFHRVAQRTIEHLDHEDCETACYRCLKTYYNQRFHDQLAWPQTIPALERAGISRSGAVATRSWQTSTTLPLAGSLFSRCRLAP